MCVFSNRRQVLNAADLGPEVLFSDPPEKATRECMHFTLVYWDTTLKAAGRDTRNWEKHHIRRHFSSQLEALWNVSPVLWGYDHNGDIQNALGKRFERGGVEF